MCAFDLAFPLAIGRRRRRRIASFWGGYRNSIQTS
jgi:hypothetical protein